MPGLGQAGKGRFSGGVSGPVQYGPRFRALLVYLNQQQLVPYERLGQVCEGLFGQPLSLATLLAANEQAHQNLESFEQELKAQLAKAQVVHADETGLRVEGKLHWLHVACNSELTFYGLHPKRGTEAMDSFGILPRLSQWLVHDFWKPYLAYDCLHDLCNGHLLRELEFVHQQHGEAWAEQLKEFLLAAHRLVQDQGQVSQSQFKRMLHQYHSILAQGRQLHPRLPAAHGRTRQSKGANLLDRLQDYDLCVLAFLVDPQAPFTNNQAERDIRMVKVQQKVSGCFRTFKGAQIFARIRSYLSTCRKQGRNLWESLCQALLGQPFMPAAPPRGP